jgi:predicted nucleic acid-binding protein
LSQKYPGINIKDILDLIAINSEFYSPFDIGRDICKDPDDDKFISCAISSKTKIIVSGDKHLLEVSGYKGIEMLPPKVFVDNYPALFTNIMSK